MGFMVRGIDTAYVRAIRGGALDANGQAAVRTVARGMGNPCRHCLGLMILASPDVAYVHVRSKFNCFQRRVDRE